MGLQCCKMQKFVWQVTITFASVDRCRFSHPKLHTGVTSEEERRTVLIIESLGGRLAKNLDRDILCILVKKVGSKKHETGQELNFPCLSMQWINDCKTQNALLPFDVYKIKPFVGLTICCTQIEPTERYQIQQLVEQNGGKFSSSMKLGECTHLIAVDPEGEKYKSARSWKNVHIVTSKWIFDCTTKQRK